jgi:cell division protein FtsB
VFLVKRMAGKHIDAGTLSRLEARTRCAKALARCAFVLFCLSLGFVVVAMAVPQMRILKKLEAKVADAKERHLAAKAESDYCRIELQALRDDTAFLEIHARDRLDLCREGEKVLRFKRDR